MSELPTELWMIIFACLDKNNLKTVRCVCQHFSLLVNPLLFDEVYVSPHRLNVDVFTKIAQHPTLSVCPRVLVYQTPKFKSYYSLQNYFVELCKQIRPFLSDVANKNPLLDEERQELLRVAEKCGDCESPEPYPESTSFRIVEESFNNYMNEVAEERHFNESGEFLASLCLGLVKLINVKEVKWGSTWNDLASTKIDRSYKRLDLPFSPSPLARSWNLFQLGPSYPLGGQLRAFNNLISMFSLTGRRRQHLHIVGIFLSWQSFDLKSKHSHIFRRHGHSAMINLESLEICISNHWNLELDDEDAGSKKVSVDGLGKVLSRTRNLQHLELNWFGGEMSTPGSNLLRFDELFSDHVFPVLQSLALRGITGSEVQISAFLRAQPQLRNLSLSVVNLEGGNWAGLVDDMRRSLRLCDLYIDPSQWENGNEDDFGPDTWIKIESYVVSGGENPLRVSG